MSSRRRPIPVPSVLGGAPHRLPPSQLAGFALLPLRAFLGFTFCFAGLQKLANPSFFHARNPASIQAQLMAAAGHSPIHGLLGPLSHHAVAVGVLIALGELAVGAGTLAGLLTRIAALGGLLISFGLFLSVSFHTKPYYTGSDSVFVFAWLPLLIAGGGPLSLDAWVVTTVAKRRARGQRPGAPPVDVQRRQLIGGVAVALGAVAMFGAGAVAGLGRVFHGSSANASEAASLAGRSAPASSSAASAASASRTTAAPTTAAPTTAAPNTPATTAAPKRTTAPTTAAPKATTPTPAATHPPGTKLGPASAVPVKGAASLTDPASGDPALVIQPSPGKFLAFDAVCPHAGCTVEYDAGRSTFVCPCHGSQFNGTTGAVEVGPASRGLREIAIAEGSDGQLYAK